MAPTPRFPKIIRLHDGLDALDEPNRRTLTLLWWGLGALLVFCFVPHLMARDFETALAAGNPEAAAVGTRTWLALAAGLVLLGTWLATRVYWLRKAVLPRKRAGLGWEYNPIRFAKNIARLRARDALEVEAYERWLSFKDADTYRAWLACRAREGV